MITNNYIPPDPIKTCCSGDPSATYTWITGMTGIATQRTCRNALIKGSLMLGWQRRRQRRESEPHRHNHESEYLLSRHSAPYFKLYNKSIGILMV